MLKRVDLHMHTTHSDGTLTPEQLVARAKSRRVDCIALTDHDTVSGVREAKDAGTKLGVEVIAGVEISVIFPPGTMHILGYFIDTSNADLLSGLKLVQDARAKRNPMIIEKLNSLGVKITLDEVVAESGGDQIGRPHFARVLVKKGYAQDSQDAFNKFLAKGASAYVDKRNITSETAIRMIHAAGGVASLAHPKQLKLKDEKEFEAEIEKLVGQGLDGLEVFSSCQSRDEAVFYKKIANRFNLVTTGGSDFHGDNRPNVDLGWMGEGACLYYDTIDQLRLKTSTGKK